MRTTLLVIAIIFIPPLASIVIYFYTESESAFKIALPVTFGATFLIGKNMLSTKGSAGYLGNGEEFLSSIFSLVSVVIKADGEIKQVEIDWIENKLKEDFRSRYADRYLEDFAAFLNTEVSLKTTCSVINRKFSYSAKISLLNFLVRLSAIDDDFSDEEHEVIREITLLLRLNDKVLKTILTVNNLHHKKAEQRTNSKPLIPKTSLELSYQILGVNTTATDTQVKKAYRKLAVLHHPDKVAHLGEKFQKVAASKFQKLVDAYETIKTSRGFS